MWARYVDKISTDPRVMKATRTTVTAHDRMILIVQNEIDSVVAEYLRNHPELKETKLFDHSQNFLASNTLGKVLATVKCNLGQPPREQ